MLKRPPEHRVDAPILWIDPTDDAWDHDRIEREKKESPKGEHPIARYYSGSTRYDLDAPNTCGGLVVTPREYLLEGVKPTVFRLRRVPGLERQQAVATARDQREWQASMWRLCRMGLVEVTDGFSGEAWDLQGGQRGQHLTEQDLQLLFDVDATLPHDLGVAVFHASAPLSAAEGKH